MRPVLPTLNVVENPSRDERPVLKKDAVVCATKLCLWSGFAKPKAKTGEGPHLLVVVCMSQSSMLSPIGLLLILVMHAGWATTHGGAAPLRRHDASSAYRPCSGPTKAGFVICRKHGGLFGGLGYVLPRTWYLSSGKQAVAQSLGSCAIAPMRCITCSAAQ